jgi:hypothetical protein
MPSKPAPAGDSESELEKYVAALPPERVALTRRLHGLIVAASPSGADHPGFDVAIKYGILMYALGGDWRRWVVAIDARSKGGVGIKFLYGVLMRDERLVLRAGSSVLKSWDLGSGADLDEAAVSAYVVEAVRLYPEFKANYQAILESARKSGAGRSGRSHRG